MKSFRYYRHAWPEEKANENKKTLEFLKAVCFLVAFVFLVTVVMALTPQWREWLSAFFK
jgi:hypothetical protein